MLIQHQNEAYEYPLHMLTLSLFTFRLNQLTVGSHLHKFDRQKKILLILIKRTSQNNDLIYPKYLQLQIGFLSSSDTSHYDSLF